MAVRKGPSPKLTVKDLRELNVRRAVEYHALKGREERTQYLLRQINEEAQERFFTAGEVEAEERALEVDQDKRTVKGVSFASDEPYLRWYGFEVLDHSPGSPNFKRLNNGGAFLREHWGEQLGVVVKKSARLDGNKSRCDLFFSQRDEAVAELRDIADGIRCNTSLRYTVDEIRWEGTKDGEDMYRVTKWTPIHVASVSDPADDSVGFGKSLTTPNNQIDPSETRACVEGDPACADENCPICYEDDTTADAAKGISPTVRKGSKKNTRARKPMALRRKKSTKTPVAKDELCKEGDPVCDNRDCEVHYEEADEREAEPVNHAVRFRSLAKSAALGPEEEKRFLKIASERALGDEPDEADLKKALLADRKNHAKDTETDQEDPAVVAARNGGEVIEVNLRSVGRLRNFKTEKEAVRYGKFLAAGVFNFKRAKSWCHDHGLLLERAQSESDNESGSIWVPQEFDATVLDLRERVGLVRQFARINQMTSATKVVRRVKGGMKAKPIGAVGVSRKIPEQKKTWNSFELIARVWGILTKIEDELTEDSLISMADEIIGEQARGFGEAEDDAFVNADGSSDFHGITGALQAFKNLSGTIANIAGLQVAIGNLYSEIVMGDFTKLVAKLPQYADNERAAFYCSRSFFFGVMVPLMLAAGGVTAGEIQNMRQKMFLGYEVHILQTMPKVEANSQVCCLFGDLWAAVDFGDRRGLTVRQTDSNDDDFENGLIAIKTTARFDIVPHDVGNASATAALRVPGPLVALITAAS